MQNKELIQKFYTAFSDGDSDSMIACYHEDVVFEDPAFGELNGDKAKSMWKMLVGRRKESETTISFNVLNDHHAEWVAQYKYGPNKRPVTNKISSKFEFQDAKIIHHTDYFSLWKWTRQALGTSGFLLGWSTFMRKKIQATTNKLLAKYMMQQKN